MAPNTQPRVTRSKSSSSKHKRQESTAATVLGPSTGQKRGRADSQADQSAATKPKKASRTLQSLTTNPRAQLSSKQKKKGPPAKQRRREKVVTHGQQVEDEEEEENRNENEDRLLQESSDESIEPGVDENDYDHADLHDAFETARWRNRGQSQRNHSKDRELDDNEGGLQNHPPDQEMEVETEDGEDGGSSKLTENQRRRQLAERPRWIGHHSTPSTSSSFSSRSRIGEGEILELTDSDQSDEESYSGDPESIQIVLAKSARYPLLNKQPPRVRCVLRRAFRVSEFKIAFETPYPPVEDADRFFRKILHEAAKEVDDDDIAQEVKTNAWYGNNLAHLVKSRFGRHRRDIRDHAKSEGRGMYQLNLGTGIAEKATALLLDDNFVYGVDIRGIARNDEPYRHPAVICMIQFFFKDRSVGQLRSSEFVSSITEAQHSDRSREKEVPIPMVAFSAAMLRAELLLWKFGHRQSLKFDPDHHLTAYNHHVEALEKMKVNFPVKFHCLMHFLYEEGRSSSTADDSRGCDGVGVLGKLGWAVDDE